MDPAVVQAILDDWRTAPISEGHRAVFGVIEMVTQRPEEIDAAAMRKPLSLGVHPDAIREALFIAFLFNTLNRCAETFEFGTPTDAEARRIGFLADKIGYGLVQIPG